MLKLKWELFISFITIDGLVFLIQCTAQDIENIAEVKAN